jgi:hypothetical protein
MRTDYFVTRLGLAAAIANASVLSNIKSVLVNHAAPDIIGDLKDRGYIAPEKRRRGVEVDHNMLVLYGALDRVSEVLHDVSHDAKVAKVTSALAAEVEAIVGCDGDEGGTRRADARPRARPDARARTRAR